MIAWAMLRDEKDWNPKRMIEVTESYGKMPEKLKESLTNMKPKENSDQRKARLRREARQAKGTAAPRTSKTSASKAQHAPASSSSTKASGTAKQKTPKRKAKQAKASHPSPRSKPQRAGKLVSRT